jgi:hypothetical protein
MSMNCNKKSMTLDLKPEGIQIFAIWSRKRMGQATSVRA